MGEAENELRDVPRRIASIAVVTHTTPRRTTADKGDRSRNSIPYQSNISCQRIALRRLLIALRVLRVTHLQCALRSPNSSQPHPLPLRSDLRKIGSQAP